MKALWIGVAGFAGAISRYGVEGWISQRSRGAFPWGTFAVNVSGCFVIGLLFTLLTERFLPNPTLRSALTIGFVGSYTTFSTFALETLRLGQEGAIMFAAINILASVAVGITAVYLGTALGRAL